MKIYGKHIIVKPTIDTNEKDDVDSFVEESGLAKECMRSPFGVVVIIGKEVDKALDISPGDTLFIANELARDIQDGTFLVHQDHILANMKKKEHKG